MLNEDQWEGEAIHRKRDGTPVIVDSRWALQRDAEGAPVRTLTLDRDITDRRLADAELLLLTNRLSLATSVAKVGVWEWELASNTLTWDDTMFDIYDLPPIATMGYEQWAATVFPEDLPAVEAALRRTILEEDQGSAEFRITLPNGSTRIVSAVERGVVDARGNVTRVIGVNIDVTERRQTEQRLEQSRNDEMRFKDEFISHVSHELRSPLTAIKQFTSILLRGVAGELNREQREYQQIVLKNVRQLQFMIDDLLEATRLETGKLTLELERVSVANAVSDALNTLQVSAFAKGIALSSDLADDLPAAYADQARLQQILIILLDNAIKFTPDGGSVTVRAQQQKEDPRFLLIEVSDTGCGINPEITDRIFERHYQVSDPVQTSRKGLGLGLYICKELVTRQGGRVWATARQDAGSTLSFTLPVFFMSDVIAPLLLDDKWPADTVALVILETRALGTWPSQETQDEWSREARSLLQRSLLPSLDVLLPNMSPGASAERIFIVAFADAVGASALANRIRAQFQGHPRLEQTGMTLVVSHRVLPPLLSDPGASTDDLVTSMAAHIEEAIRLNLSGAALS